MKRKHPMQQIYKDKHGTARFRENAIVRAMLDFASQHGFDMNHIGRVGFRREDQEQFAQLIGYSVSGFGDLSYASRATIKEADAQVEKLLAKRKKK